MGVEPEVGLVVERVEDRPRRVAPGVRDGLEPGHELVLVDDAVAGVGRIREAAALGGPRLVEARRQEVRRLVDVAAARLVGRDVAGDRDAHHDRGSGGMGRGHVRADGLSGHAAAAQEAVVLMLEVGAGIRGVRLPVVGRPAVPAEPRQAQPAGAAGPVRVVPPVDEGGDGLAWPGRVDREADGPPATSAAARERWRGVGEAVEGLPPPPPHAQRQGPGPRTQARPPGAPEAVACSTVARGSRLPWHGGSTENTRTFRRGESMGRIWRALLLAGGGGDGGRRASCRTTCGRAARA